MIGLRRAQGFVLRALFRAALESLLQRETAASAYTSLAVSPNKKWRQLLRCFLSFEVLDEMRSLALERFPSGSLSGEWLQQQNSTHMYHSEQQGPRTDSSGAASHFDLFFVEREQTSHGTPLMCVLFLVSPTGAARTSTCVFFWFFQPLMAS